MIAKFNHTDGSADSRADHKTGTSWSTIQFLESTGSTSGDVKRIREVILRPIDQQAAMLSIFPGQRMTIGRTDFADHRIIADSCMSRIHFEIRCQPRRVILADCGSTNGTFLNGIRIDVAEIKDCDQINAGSTVFQVRLNP